MNFVLFTWLTIAVCYICTSYAQEKRLSSLDLPSKNNLFDSEKHFYQEALETSESNCGVHDGKPNIIKQNIKFQDSAENCSEACKAETQCLLWQYNKKSKKCKISVFKKANGGKYSSFGINNCNAPKIMTPTTCPPPVTCPPKVTCPTPDPTVTDPTVTNATVVDPTVTDPTETTPTITTTTVTTPTVTTPTVTTTTITNPPESVSPVTNTTVKNPPEPTPTVTNPPETTPPVTNTTVKNPPEPTPTVTYTTITNPPETTPKVTNATVKNPPEPTPTVTNTTVTNSPETTPTVTNTTVTNSPETTPTVRNTTVTHPPDCPNCPATSCSNCKACKVGWSSYNGFCFKVFAETFPDQYHAKAKCESEGAELATIHSSQELNFVKDLLAKSSVEWQAWIAGTDADSEGSWEWSKGCPVIFFDWAPGEPNNHNDEHCLVLWKDHEWNMNDYYCWKGGINAVCKTTD